MKSALGKGWKWLLGSLLTLLGFSGCERIGIIRCEYEKWESDTLYSDAQGHFEKERLKHDWPDGAQKAAVKFEDVDGDAHGSFKTKILKGSELTVEQTKKGDKHWYSGGYTIRADAVLEEEE